MAAYVFIPAAALILALVVWLGLRLMVIFTGILTIEAFDWIDSSAMSVAFGTALALFLGGYQSLVWAWRGRASDIVIDPAGFAVEGGRHDGLFVPWAKLDTQK